MFQIFTCLILSNMTNVSQSLLHRQMLTEGIKLTKVFFIFESVLHFKLHIISTTDKYACQLTFYIKLAGPKKHERWTSL